MPGEIGLTILELSKERLLKLIRVFARWIKILTSIQVGIDVANHPFYHYTDAGGFAGISSSGNINATTADHAFYSTDVYLRGVDARSSLALDKLPIGMFAIPFHQIVHRFRSGPEPAAPMHGQLGGGTEYSFLTPVFVPPETEFFIIPPQ